MSVRANNPTLMPRSVPRSTIAALCTGTLLIAIFAAMVVWLQSDLRSEIHLKILERDAAVLYPMALQQVSENGGITASSPFAALRALLRSSRQKGMLGVAVFDRDGNAVEAVPSTQLFVELQAEDLLRLQGGRPITRYHPLFALDQYFADVSREQGPAPVLEVLLPLPGSNPSTVLGFVRYYIDARPVAGELALIDGRVDRETFVTLAVGALLIAAVLAGAAFSIRRAERVAAERNERLVRANFELTLAAKVSVIGQIASHLIHGLQGAVAGLRTVVSEREGDPSNPAWELAAGYADRLQTIVQETVALLGDAGAHASYELSGRELASTIRDRYAATASEKGVLFEVNPGFSSTLDSHRGSLLCLIANNLVQNAVAATAAGRRVTVSLIDNGGVALLSVADEGSGISAAAQEDLFKPGRSSRPGGSGLGLAISQLLARQIGAELSLQSTGPLGTTFVVTLHFRG